MKNKWTVPPIVLACLLCGPTSVLVAGELTGKIVSADGKAVAGATVRASPIHPGQWAPSDPADAKGPSGKTTADGSFSIGKLQPGWHALTVIPSGPTAGSASETYYVKLRGARHDAGAIHLPRPAARITGRVTYGGNAPTTGHASLYDATYGIETQTVELGADGSFVFRVSWEARGAGHVRIVAYGKGTFGYTVRAVTVPDRGASLDLGRINIDQAPATGVVCQTVDAMYQPIGTDYVVYAFDPDKPLRVLRPVMRSDAGSLGLLLPIGRWRLVLARDGHGPIVRDVNVRKGTTNARLLVHVPPPSQAGIEVRCDARLGAWKPAPAFWRSFSPPPAVAVLRSPGQEKAPLWMLRWVWVQPGQSAYLPGKADAEGQRVELWQVRRAGAAYRPIRRIASAPTTRGIRIEWDVLATIRQTCLDEIHGAGRSPAQVAARVEILSELVASKQVGGHRRLGEQLAALARQVAATPPKEVAAASDRE